MFFRDSVLFFFAFVSMCICHMSDDCHGAVQLNPAMAGLSHDPPTPAFGFRAFRAFRVFVHGSPAKLWPACPGNTSLLHSLLKNGSVNALDDHSMSPLLHAAAGFLRRSILQLPEWGSIVYM